MRDTKASVSLRPHHFYEGAPLSRGSPRHAPRRRGSNGERGVARDVRRHFPTIPLRESFYSSCAGAWRSPEERSRQTVRVARIKSFLFNAPNKLGWNKSCLIRRIMHILMLASFDYFLKNTGNFIFLHLGSIQLMPPVLWRKVIALKIFKSVIFFFNACKKF